MDSDPGPLIRDVQRDAIGLRSLAAVSADDPLACSIRDAVRCAHDPGDPREGNVLLLSGGGQWGAYGAGLFRTLSEASGCDLALPGMSVITGVSTGALQTLMLMVALDPDQDRAMRRHAIARLIWGYSPERQSEVVDYTGLFAMPVYGSAAGTAPLRKRIIEALCPAGDCRLVEAIAASSIAGYAGFVEAESGLLRYADMRALARAAATPEAAAQALAAATMASSAMPVFHQQLRIAGSDAQERTLYDGGVRRSVFFDRAMTMLDREVRAHMPDEGAVDGDAFAAEYARTAPTVYVVRNGPTVRESAPGLNAKSGPLLNGQRGYDLLVNESEIAAIAALRLGNPYGRIMVTTADQYDTFPCENGENFKEGEMFKPAFMDCLRDLGRYKAVREGGAWWPLSPLDRAR